MKSASRVVVLALLCGLGACGGGDGPANASNAGNGSAGSGSGGASVGTPGTSAPAGAVPTSFGPDYSDGQATLSALSAGRTAWNAPTAAIVTLKSSPGGLAVSGALKCVSDAPMQLEVAGDCATVKGLRLGVYTVTVSGAGASAKATVKVIPQPQPLGTGFMTVAAMNLAVSPNGRPLVWGARSSAMVVHPEQADLSTVALPDAIRTRNGGVLGGMVAAGRSTLGFMYLSEDGEVYTSGNPRLLGRLPILTSSSIQIPFDAYAGKVTLTENGPALQHVVSISMGLDNLIALTDEGQVYYWGTFSGDIFGVGVAADHVLRVLPLPDKAVAVSAGSNWCMVLLANGRVMTLVSSGEGFYKQAGRPAMPPYTPGFVVDRNTQQPLEDIVSIAAGASSGYAVNKLGQVWAWGKADFDQLGQNTIVDGLGALLVRSPDGQSYLSGITTVAAGGDHALALHRNSQVYSWGYNDRGQLGDGQQRVMRYGGTYGSLPGLVLNEAGTMPLTGVRVIDAGLNHSLALGADGQLRSWGNGANFGLGQGVSHPLSYLPLVVVNEAGNAPLSFNPMSRWPNPTAP